ncbi:MAG TPA: nucleoside phosphorylase [Marinilabiliaceae bacterium]|nr:nucleoside phosphorylase [Marinilabiliaceae bacterium]
MTPIADSELILNPDGSVFHLHMKPKELAHRIILVGDPGRVAMVGGFFEEVLHQGSNREFVWKTGVFNKIMFTVLSTGIGTDNIDIVLNELDALVNIDFETRLKKKTHTTLQIVRIGTSGSLQQDLPVDSWLLSKKAIGFDGLLNFYARRNEVSDLPFEETFVEHTGWLKNLPAPYVVNADKNLLKDLSGGKMVEGVTISAPGFYGPQGRVLRLPLALPQLNEKISSFKYQGQIITNFEMECSAIYGLSALLGHRAATVCVIIANRWQGTYSKNYKQVVEHLVEYVLRRLSK